MSRGERAGQGLVGPGEFVVSVTEKGYPVIDIGDGTLVVRRVQEAHATPSERRMSRRAVSAIVGLGLIAGYGVYSAKAYDTANRNAPTQMYDFSNPGGILDDPAADVEFIAKNGSLVGIARNLIIGG